MSYKNIVFELGSDGIATLVVNRPSKLNALNRETIEELDAAFERIEREPAVRAAILTGAGEKAFAAGADISELAEATPLGAMQISAFGQKVFRRLQLLGKPTVAALNGFTLGGGLELALACTFRVAAQGVRLGMPETRLGIVPGYGGTQRLPMLVGRAKALELLLTADPIPADEAARIGLVNHVVAAEDLLSFSRQLLLKITANGPVATGLVMQAVDVGLNVGLEEGLRYETTAFGLAASTADCKEGFAAFLEKRPAVFTGQ